MLKHLIKKYLNIHKLTEEQAKTFDSLPQMTNLGQVRFNDMGYGAVLTESNDFIGAFKYVDNQGLTMFIPEPDLIVVYFETARSYSRHLQRYRDELFKDLTLPDKVLSNFYGYYAMATIVIINIFNSLEAAINRAIPNDFSFAENPQGKSSTLYSPKDAIEREFSLEKKIKLVLPQATDKNFVAAHNDKYEFIIKQLKPLRDEMIHAKSYSKEKLGLYEKLYNNTLNFDYEKCLRVIMTFINFYHQDLLQECQCGNDTY